MSDTIVIGASFAQRPRVGGHHWVRLQYLLGLKRLGWDVLLLDRIEPEMCVDSSGRPSSFEGSLNVSYALKVLDHYGLAESYSLSYNRGEQIVGLPRKKVLERVRDSAFFLNIMGYFDDESVLAAAPRLIFLDLDPGFGQMWLDLGLHDIFRGHDDFVTIGENIGEPDCTIPTCGLKWLTTPQPVVLDYWPVTPASRNSPFSSVVTWRGRYDPIEYRGEIYGLRVHEFRKFVELPKLTGQQFELALDIHPEESRDLELLEVNQWKLIHPIEAASDPWSYQSYVQRSRAEFMVAKGIYVQSRSGWFSDRSICYLASGRPVLAQDTGLEGRYPIGNGLITYSTIDEAVDGVGRINRDFDAHARAARSIAEEYFDSDKVLNSLLDRLGVAK